MSHSYCNSYKMLSDPEPPRSVEVNLVAGGGGGGNLFSVMDRSKFARTPEGMALRRMRYGNKTREGTCMNNYG